jgi:hypothetical protein
MRLDAAHQIWVVRHTNLLLVSWFLGLLCVALWTVVWPAFDRYVDRLKVEAQWQEVQAELAALTHQLKDQQQALEALELEWPVMEFQSLTAEMGAFADAIQVKRGATHWTFILTGESATLVQMGHYFATAFSGTRLTQLRITADDEAVQMMVRLELTESQVRRRMTFADLPPAANTTMRFGEIHACPPLSVLSRFGDAVHVEGGTERQWLQLGDLIDEVWQLIGVRDGQLLLKSDIGGVCFSKVGVS